MFASMDLETGVLSPPQLAAETPNPTFLDLNPQGKFLYAANEISRFEGKHRLAGGERFFHQRGHGSHTLRLS